MIFGFGCQVPNAISWSNGTVPLTVSPTVVTFTIAAQVSAGEHRVVRRGMCDDIDSPVLVASRVV